MNISRNERNLREVLRSARVRPEGNSRDQSIYNAARSICNDGRVFYILTETPDQSSDAFEILVDDRFVIGFEINRNFPNQLPTDVSICAVEDFKKIIIVEGIVKK